MLVRCFDIMSGASYRDMAITPPDPDPHSEILQLTTMDGHMICVVLRCADAEPEINVSLPHALL